LWIIKQLENIKVSFLQKISWPTSTATSSKVKWLHWANLSGGTVQKIRRSLVDSEENFLT
jgi:hypothetical protein